MTEKLAEERIIALAEKFFQGAGPADRAILKGLGDDAAVLEAGGGEVWLLSADILVQDVHFRTAWISPEDLGVKTLAVNVSDIAAMGGNSLFGLLTLALPADLTLDWVERFLSSLGRAARESGVAVLGGDTTGSPGPIMIGLTVLGRARKEEVIYRSSAQPGDTLFISRPTGLSGAALAALEAGLVPGPDLAQAFFRPRPEMALGPFLARTGLVRAMIDLSDGLVPDAGRLAQASELAAIIEPGRVPLAASLLDLGQRLNQDPLKWVLAGGEDYGLLFSCPAGKAAELADLVRREMDREIFPVGRLEEGRGVWLLDGDLKEPAGLAGFDHFGRKNDKS